MRIIMKMLRSAFSVRLAALATRWTNGRMVPSKATEACRHRIFNRLCTATADANLYHHRIREACFRIRFGWYTEINIDSRTFILHVDTVWLSV